MRGRNLPLSFRTSRSGDPESTFSAKGCFFRTCSCLFRVRKSKSVSRPSGASSFSLFGQRKRSKREATLFPRPTGILPYGFVLAGRAFRRHILCRRKGWCIRAPAPAGLVVRPSPLHRGPGKAADSCPRWCARCARTPFKRRMRVCFSGPLCSGRGLRLRWRWRAAAPRTLARRGADTMSARFPKVHGRASGKPRKPARTLRTGSPQSAEAGCPSLWFVSLGQAREMNSRPKGVKRFCSSSSEIPGGNQTRGTGAKPNLRPQNKTRA